MAVSSGDPAQNASARELKNEHSDSQSDSDSGLADRVRSYISQCRGLVAKTEGWSSIQVLAMTVEMVPRELMEMERDRAEMYRDQLACAQAKIVHQKKRLRELERLQANKKKAWLLP